jgi:hypothetical protein
VSSDDQQHNWKEKGARVAPRSPYIRRRRKNKTAHTTDV